MTKKKAAKKAAAKKTPKSEADPRFEPVAKALARVAGFSLMESKSGGLRGMMLHGKSFGMSSHGRFIVKLDEARAKELVDTRVAKPFSMSPGRVMKIWVVVTDAKADWVALAKEALALAKKK